jgi:hypothetical protein
MEAFLCCIEKRWVKAARQIDQVPQGMTGEVKDVHDGLAYVEFETGDQGWCDPDDLRYSQPFLK